MYCYICTFVFNSLNDFFDTSENINMTASAPTYETERNLS